MRAIFTRLFSITGAVLLLAAFAGPTPTRTFTYRGEEVPTSVKVPAHFLGKYTGRNGGYLQLNADGTGVYVYDYFVYPLEGCIPGPISIEWGFLVDDNGGIFRYDRQYGYSYPLILKATSEQTSFQGCRESIIMDYILVRDRELSVSSSDDWVKNF